MSFPSRRLRRLRSTPAMRDLVRESTIDPSDLVLPIFVQEGIDSPVEIKSMPESSNPRRSWNTASSKR